MASTLSQLPLLSPHFPTPDNLVTLPPHTSLKRLSPPKPRFLACTFNPENQQPAGSVKPTYSPTPPNRDLRTPHSGYHFDESTRKFFEGWYFKVSIPERRQSFCFMYSVESPSFPKKLTPLEVAQYGTRFTGVGVQILGANDKYICQFSEESQNFWGGK